MSTIYDQIRDSKPAVEVSGHTPLPYIPKQIWTELGDYVAAKERIIKNSSDEDVITLRLDITGMSTLRKRMSSLGVMFDRPRGWSEKFANMMMNVAQSLAQKFGASWVYTQSDEITLIIVPSGAARYKHPRGGKAAKLISLTAALLV